MLHRTIKIFVSRMEFLSTHWFRYKRKQLGFVPQKNKDLLWFLEYFFLSIYVKMELLSTCGFSIFKDQTVILIYELFGSNWVSDIFFRFYLIKIHTLSNVHYFIFLWKRLKWLIIFKLFEPDLTSLIVPISVTYWIRNIL